MRIKTALATSAIAAGMLAGIGAPLAAAEEATTYLGQQGTLTNGDIVQGWTITGLKPSSDVIPYQPAGALWEATATNQAIQGNVTPIVSNLNARAGDGQTYRALFGVATAEGVNPSTLAQGEQTTGKVYFDVTGAIPDSVVYSTMGGDQLTWLPAPPPVVSAQSPSVSAPAAVAPSVPAATADTVSTPATAPSADGTPVAEGAQGTPVVEGSQGTPVVEGAQGTPVVEGAQGTPVVEGAPAPAAAGTPVVEGSQGTPAPAGEGAPSAATVETTAVVPPPAS